MFFRIRWNATIMLSTQLPHLLKLRAYLEKQLPACRELWMNACGNSKERERAKHLLHLSTFDIPKISQNNSNAWKAATAWLHHSAFDWSAFWGCKGFKIKRYRRPHKKDIPPDGSQCLSSMWCHLSPACIGCVWHLKFIDLKNMTKKCLTEFSF